MKMTLLAAVGVFIIACGLSMFSRREGLRAAGRAVLLLYFIALSCAAIGCFVFPLFAPKGSGAAVMMFPGFFAGLFAWIAWMFWASAHDYKKVAALPDAEKLAWLENSTEKMVEELTLQLENDEKDVKKFWISPRRRQSLRERIGHNKFMLANLPKLPKLYADHLRDKQAEEAPAQDLTNPN